MSIKANFSAKAEKKTERIEFEDGNWVEIKLYMTYTEKQEYEKFNSSSIDRKAMGELDDNLVAIFTNENDKEREKALKKLSPKDRIKLTTIMKDDPDIKIEQKTYLLGVFVNEFCIDGKKSTDVDYLIDVFDSYAIDFIHEQIENVIKDIAKRKEEKGDKKKESVK